MFEGFTAKLHAKKIAALKEAELAAIQKEKELLEIEKLENSIEKHREVDRRRIEKKIERVQKLKGILGKIGANEINIETQTPEERQAEADKKLEKLSNDLKGSNNGVQKERGTEAHKS